MVKKIQRPVSLEDCCMHRQEAGLHAKADQGGRGKQAARCRLQQRWPDAASPPHANPHRTRTCLQISC
jgi:hypothetical protein